ncbi:MAG TPA: hypothetical protein VFG54_01230 [Prolixibacteraceae bacterium]|nr:hypothetical protein [Prolixibacteraceae bacterium]
MSEKHVCKSLFSTLNIEITKTGVEVKKKTLSNYDEYQIEFDALTTKKTIKKEMNIGLLFLCLGFLIPTIFNLLDALFNSDSGFGTTIFFSVITLFFLLVSISTRKRIVTLTSYYGQKELEIPFNNKNELKVREFADLIIEKTKEFLINKYAKVDKDLPKDTQLENIISLKDRHLITDDEFDRLKNILLDKDPNKNIGFY